MTHTRTDSDRIVLVNALRLTRGVRADEVNRFGLQIDEAGIRPVNTGWVVPVASGVATGSAFELARTLTSLQDLAEQKSHLSISLFLDPFAKAS